MIDLLQVESVPATQRKPTRSEPEPDVKEGEKAPHAASSVNAKFPPLRRAALHFLALLTQACTRHVFETGSAERLLLPPGLFRRAKTTLGYIAATDADDVVRVMARETVDALDQLAEAIVGL